jgi:hypothetical protein
VGDPIVSGAFRLSSKKKAKKFPQWMDASANWPRRYNLENRHCCRGFPRRNTMVAPLPVSEPVPSAVVEAPPAAPPSVLFWNVAALLVALTATAGTLWLSLGMGLWACPLCYYQRAFMLGVAAVLLMAMLTDVRATASTSVLAMPLCAAGLGIAGWHVYLESAGKLICPAGVFDIGSSPQQSLAAYALSFLLLAIGGRRRPALVVAIVIGLLLAAACVLSVAKLPPVLDARICHPPG